MSDDQKIILLKGPERVRKRAAVIFGSDDEMGAATAVQMLLDILAQESIDGHCSWITLTQYGDDSIEIQNDGRGIFLADDAWERLFCQINTGTREYPAPKNYFEPPQKEKPVDSLDICSVQYASESMDVWVIRDGCQQTLHFEKGYNVGGLTQVPSQDHTGTKIRFRPDPEVFSQIALGSQVLTGKLQALAISIPGLKVTFRKETDAGFAQQEFYYPAGVGDYLQAQKEGKEATPVYTAQLAARWQERYNAPCYYGQVKVGICFAKDAGFVKCYHNYRELPYGGDHRDAAIRKIFRYVQWRLERDIAEEDLLKHLQLVLVTHSEKSDWVNGNRTGISNSLLRDLTEDAIYDAFQNYVKENEAFLDQLF